MGLKDKVICTVARFTGMMVQAKSHHNPEKQVNPAMPELLRSAAAQGAVLLENRVLPLQKGTRVSVFGRPGPERLFLCGLRLRRRR